MVTWSFKRKERLKKDSSIKAVFDKGLPLKGRLINVYLLKKDQGPQVNRAAFIIRRNLYNKKLVTRNRFRRILREAYRKTKCILPLGFDIVIVAVGLKKDTMSIDIEKELRRVFEKVSKK